MPWRAAWVAPIAASDAASDCRPADWRASAWSMTTIDAAPGHERSHEQRPDLDTHCLVQDRRLLVGDGADHHLVVADDVGDPDRRLIEFVQWDVGHDPARARHDAIAVQLHVPARSASRGLRVGW